LARRGEGSVPDARTQRTERAANCLKAIAAGRS
jgi:hypothetical protein